MNKTGILLLLVSIFLNACSPNSDTPATTPGNSQIPDTTSTSGGEPEQPTPEIKNLLLGADLSYVNEMEQCDAIYNTSEGDEIDLFKLFAEKGANIVRARLWKDPEWTDYSTLQDVKKTFSRAKEQGMKTLLDIQYSDTWADPAHQQIPDDWKNIQEVSVLKDSVYNYTYNVLQELQSAGLGPAIVQIGNEINSEILQYSENTSGPINWSRNSTLINAGIKAVRDFSSDNGEEVEVMLHIAQPENALWWFKEAKQNGVSDYDWIGLSYYPSYSEYKINNISQALRELKETYNKKVMIVETAYPYTMENVDSANNNLGQDALISGYEATPEGQKQYLIELAKAAIDGGAGGVIYWEPAWVSTNCYTQWGQGSHWDNATLFDSHSNNALPGFDFYNQENYSH